MTKKKRITVSKKNIVGMADAEFVPVEELQREILDNSEKAYGDASPLMFEDVEESLPIFSGHGRRNMKKWLHVLNYISTHKFNHWSKKKKISYIKRLLRSSAALFKENMEIWKQLKENLITKFVTVVNSQQVHQELICMRKKSNETYQEFMYRVLVLVQYYMKIEMTKKNNHLTTRPIKDTPKKTRNYKTQNLRRKKPRSNSLQKD